MGTNIWKKEVFIMTKTGTITNVIMVVAVGLLTLLQSGIIILILMIGAILWILSKCFGFTWQRLH